MLVGKCVEKRSPKNENILQDILKVIGRKM